MTCLSPYKVPQVNEGRFLQWTAVSYILENQTGPIELCTASTDPCNYDFPDETESYSLPIKTGDVVKWIMNKNEFTIDPGSSLSDLKIGIVKEGILAAENVGTIIDLGGSQYYCTATIPCLTEGCDYQFVIYDDSIDPPVDCGLYKGDTLQQVITANISLGQVLDCTLSDFI